LLLHPDSTISPATEALLFLSARAQVVAEIVGPALARGEWVVADRFFVSTYAYQIAGHGLDDARVRSANALATGGNFYELRSWSDDDWREARERIEAQNSKDRAQR